MGLYFSLGYLSGRDLPLLLCPRDFRDVSPRSGGSWTAPLSPVIVSVDGAKLSSRTGEKACLERVGTLGLQLSPARLITERSPAALPGCKLNKQYFLYTRAQGGQREQCGLIAVISSGFNLCPLPPTSSPAPCLPLYPICHLLPCFKERQGEKCSVQIIF